ncbi:hypothetical protein [Bacillus wiedmannii]|uniref:hypothetical protein n=1 Tax=Bacillus wiedmannii TaxID=1890302 RepID=UPI000BF881E4|nr:hypothetical protein [Bacillus wiedmannii]PEP14046.1 hypothetical protein CN552_16340 [Bacillus wiedmannii]
MENIRDLLFQQNTLDLLFKKWGVSKNSIMIPWNNGFALTNQAGNITNYLNIDSNGQLLFQNNDFSTIGSVSSVSDMQYQIYDQHHLIGHLFNSPNTYSNLDSFFDLTQNDAATTLSHVLDIDVDSVDSLLNVNDIIDFF